MIRQYLREALIDEMHIAIAPVPLGSGERLFDDIDLPRLALQIHPARLTKGNARRAYAHEQEDP